MGYLWIWMSIKVLCRNPTFGGFIIWAKAQRIRMTFNSLLVHRRAFCQRALAWVFKETFTKIEGWMSAFQIIYFHATQVERRSGLCNAFSSLLYFSVLVIPRLNGRYYVGGSGSKRGQIKKRKRRRRNVWKKRARGRTVGELISVACFSVTAVLLPLWLKLRTIKLISAASGTVHTKGPSSRCVCKRWFQVAAQI